MLFNFYENKYFFWLQDGEVLYGLFIMWSSWCFFIFNFLYNFNKKKTEQIVSEQ